MARDVSTRELKRMHEAGFITLPGLLLLLPLQAIFLEFCPDDLELVRAIAELKTKGFLATGETK